ncbi:potassium-transporting ATPase subunit KdpC [Kineococcus rubinsiae]|uniref:potassium-transporting ATPase subunit KdpC n=1 Tax=Kineococcus rubinsiae TaxID=2609562 RepID=UPI00142FEBA1|nr:potassium-transporting ATPase subunit KdpC [Kineococcus rubinsiae]NIZ89732.1 potassium-transporting ATPase subunit KdpC [Kineococcus rubinsiae]
MSSTASTATLEPAGSTENGGAPTASLTALVRQARTGLVLLVAMTALLGLVYPGVVYAVGRLVPERADGQVVRVDGRPVGSALIGQQFTGAQWFAPRPSAAGDGYDPLASGASNLGPESTDLATSVAERRAAVAAADGVDPASVPADALTASGSGLDPDISPAYAQEQVARVARARGLDLTVVAGLVAAHTSGRAAGFLGEEHVNVLELNVALAATAG